MNKKQVAIQKSTEESADREVKSKLQQLRHDLFSTLFKERDQKVWIEEELQEIFDTQVLSQYLQESIDFCAVSNPPVVSDNVNALILIKHALRECYSKEFEHKIMELLMSMLLGDSSVSDLVSQVDQTFFQCLKARSAKRGKNEN